MAKGPWETEITSDGQVWPSWVFRVLDEKFIVEVPGQGRRLAYPGRPDLCAHTVKSFSAAASANQTRGVEALFACSTLSVVGVWDRGGPENFVVHGPGQSPPADGRALAFFCGTPDLASTGASARADNKARQGRKTA